MNASVMSRLEHHGVVPVIRLPSTELAHRAVAGLAAAGFTTFEITMSVPGAVELIAELAEHDGYLVGGGTVLSLEQAGRCLEAGARYLVSPCFLEGLPGMCREAGAACLMGGLTPSEVLAVARAGAEAVKVFPASSMGGPAHLKALREVFPEIALVPTGGVKLENLADYVRAGAAFVGVGGNLVNPSVPDFAERARAYLTAYQQAKAALTENPAKGVTHGEL